MGVLTFEGVMKDGQIRLNPDVRLPDKTKVFVLVPDMQIEPAARIFSPRLAHPDQTADFQMAIFEETSDAEL